MSRLNQADRSKLVQATVPGLKKKTEPWPDNHPEAQKLHNLIFGAGQQINLIKYTFANYTFWDLLRFSRRAD